VLSPRQLTPHLRGLSSHDKNGELRSVRRSTGRRLIWCPCQLFAKSPALLRDGLWKTAECWEQRGGALLHSNHKDRPKVSGRRAQKRVRR
jgi:hypothetical protein